MLIQPFICQTTLPFKGRVLERKLVGIHTRTHCSIWSKARRGAPTSRFVSLFHEEALAVQMPDFKGHLPHGLAVSLPLSPAAVESLGNLSMHHGGRMARPMSLSNSNCSGHWIHFVNCLAIKKCFPLDCMLSYYLNLMTHLPKSLLFVFPLPAGPEAVLSFFLNGSLLRACLPISSCVPTGNLDLKQRWE